MNKITLAEGRGKGWVIDTVLDDTYCEIPFWFGKMKYKDPMARVTWICPHCKEELERLSFGVKRWEWGEKELVDGYVGDWDDTEYEDSGEERYECPYCNELLNDIIVF